MILYDRLINNNFLKWIPKNGGIIHGKKNNVCNIKC